METFLLLMLTMNIQTGAIVKSVTIGSPFSTYDDCLQGAISRGPQVSDGLHAQILVCKSSSDKAADAAVAPGANKL